MNKRNRMPIVAFDDDGNKVGKFKSIKAFGRFAGVAGTPCLSQMKLLRLGRVVSFGGYHIGLAKFHKGVGRINPLRSYRLMSLRNRIKRNNFIKLKKFNDSHQLIVVVDSNLKLLGYYHNRSLKEIAKSQNLPLGTIKASLNRSRKRFANRTDNRITKHFIHLEDFSRFLKNVERTGFSRIK